jgi:uncharacterized protein (TIRG00374 family)
MALFKISLEDLWTTIALLKVWQLTTLVLLYLVIAMASIIARKYLLQSLSCQPRLKHLVYIHFAAMATHYSTPAKLGFPLTVYLLKKFENVPYAKGTAMIVIELVVSTGICGVIALVGSYLYFIRDGKAIIIAFFCLLFLSLLAIYVFPLILKKTRKHLRLYEFVKNVHEAFSSIPMNSLLIYSILAFILQVLGSLNLLLLGYFFSLKLSLLQSLVISSSAFFWGAVSMIPLGLGVREAAVILFLKILGVENAVGLSIATVQRLITTGLSFVLGVIFGMILAIKKDHDHIA